MTATCMSTEARRTCQVLESAVAGDSALLYTGDGSRIQVFCLEEQQVLSATGPSLQPLRFSFMLIFHLYWSSYTLLLLFIAVDILLI